MSRRFWIILAIILILLAFLFDFNPLHPVDSWHHIVFNVHQGWEDAGRDKAAAEARAARQAAHADSIAHSTSAPR